jgi:hypothetical protein
MQKIFVSLLLIAAAESARVNFRACPGGLNPPDWVESNWCTADKCTVTRGQSFSARIGMTLGQSFSVLNVAIKATLLGLPFPIDLPPGYENGCDFLEDGKTCPTQAGGFYVWNAVVPVDPSYPAASGIDLQGNFPCFCLTFRFVFIEFVN